MDMTERLRALVDPVIAEHDVELYDLELAGGTLRLTIDRPGGVDLEAIGSVTRAVSRLIDEHDPVPGGFLLEVTSPGLERALRTPEHFAKAVGETVNLKTRAGVEGDRRLKGTIEAADDAGVTVVPEGSAEPRTLTYAQIERARTVFDWGPTPKPGARRSSPSAEQKKAAKP